MTSKKESVLIVDDEETVRRLLYQKLSDEGYQCQVAARADEALYQMRSNSPALMILDIKMPGKSGIEILPEIQASRLDTAVIMATAIDDTRIAIQCMKQGAYDYITKPFDLDEVAMCVDRALHKRRLERENREYQQHLEQKVEEQASKIRTAFLNAITALAYALEAKDKYTSGHSQRVAEISVAIARKLGVTRVAIEQIRLAGSVHDIGKIGVRESILNKPTGLTNEEYQQLKSHCEAGERILAPVVEEESILKAVRHHHEHYDGTGYPDGLSGIKIPLGARILAVADAYDAMTSERSYREAMNPEIAGNEVVQATGSQFDPEVVHAFFRTRKAIIHIVRRHRIQDDKAIGSVSR